MQINTAQDVRRFLETHYITHKDFAALVGVHGSYISNIIAERHRYRLTRLMRLRIQRAVDILEANPPEVAIAPGVREARMTVLAGF